MYLCGIIATGTNSKHQSFMNIKIFTILVSSCLFLASCGNREKEQAAQLLSQAGAPFEGGGPAAARADIDSLKKTFPNIIEARTGTVKLHQDIELKTAQDELD